MWVRNLEAHSSHREWHEHEVKELIKNYKNSKSMMKASKGRQMQGMLRKLGMG